MTFDLQSVWTADGAAGAALFLGFVLGVLQSLIPMIPSTGVVRNWIIGILAVALVALAASQTGQTPNPTNIFTAALVALGIYAAATAAHAAGTAGAVAAAPDSAKEIGG